MIRLATILIVVLMSWLTAYASAETIQVLTYHNHPPFINAKGKGLTYDLEEVLNEQGQGKYTFEVLVLPRKRLNFEIKQEGSWIVIWVNPLWFGDKKETKFQWVNILKMQTPSSHAPITESNTRDQSP